MDVHTEGEVQKQTQVGSEDRKRIEKAKRKHSRLLQENN
jgi:hypothetical protein